RSRHEAVSASSRNPQPLLTRLGARRTLLRRCRMPRAAPILIYAGAIKQGEDQMKKALFVGAMLLAGRSARGQAPLLPTPGFCSLSQSVVGNVLAQLTPVVNLKLSNGNNANGGLFTPNKMWAAVVDRKGVLCAVISSDPDAWPGSRAIAIAKAYTANAF